jgi:hypothetical protein
MGYVMFLGNRRALRTLRANKVNMWKDGNKGEGEKKQKRNFHSGDAHDAEITRNGG